MDQRATVDDGERRTLQVLAVVVGVLAVLVVLPYLTYVLAAVVLAYVLFPLQRTLAPRLGRSVAALVGLVVATIAILAPITILVSVAVEQALELADALAAGDVDVDAFEDRLAEYGIEIDVEELYWALEEPIEAGVRGLAADALGIVGGLPGVLIGVLVLLFVLYSLLRDGDRLLEWATSVTPLREEVQAELIDRLDRLMYASVVANVAVAAVQAILTVIGLAIVGIPGLAFFGILTFLFALLPLVGAFAVWAPIAIYLAVVDQLLAGAFLLVYGSLVSLSDNFLRPITVGRGADLDAATVIVGIFGGVAIFGILGIFFGPVVLGASKTILEVYARERDSTRERRHEHEYEREREPGTLESGSRPEPGLVGVRPRGGAERPSSDTREG